MSFDLISEKVISLAKEYGAKSLIIFGSILDDPDNANDLDIACDIPGLALFTFAGRLEEELNFPIDVIPIEPENPFIAYIKKHGKVINVN
jgi:predicted nucleotidyltransferase